MARLPYFLSPATSVPTIEAHPDTQRLMLVVFYVHRHKIHTL